MGEGAPEGRQELTPGQLVVVDFPGNPLHGQRVLVNRIEPALDIAHPDCPERMLVEMVFIMHPSLPQPIGIGPERLAGTAQNARLRERESDDGGAQMEMLL
jgi:hypothetical protein